MPKSLERKLKRAARKKFGSTTSKRARAYIWGNDTMQEFMHNSKRKLKKRRAR